MSAGSSESLQPTFTGHVAKTVDALILFEACMWGSLRHVLRRPYGEVRERLTCSGCVLIFNENDSGIKRWSDGVHWNPSRILGDFLVYRELLQPFPQKEKKRATKQNKRLAKPGEPYSPKNSITRNGSTALSLMTPPTPSFRQ